VTPFLELGDALDVVHRFEFDVRDAELRSSRAEARDRRGSRLAGGV